MFTKLNRNNQYLLLPCVKSETYSYKETIKEKSTIWYYRTVSNKQYSYEYCTVCDPNSNQHMNPRQSYRVRLICSMLRDHISKRGGGGRHYARYALTCRAPFTRTSTVPLFSFHVPPRSLQSRLIAHASSDACEEQRITVLVLVVAKMSEALHTVSAAYLFCYIG